MARRKEADRLAEEVRLSWLSILLELIHFSYHYFYF
jgi:hypothetical protein